MIGVFDSGIGGLTVIRKMFEILSQYQLLYFGDTARTPYGGRGEAVIKKYAFEVAEFLVKRGAKIIVIACNTVSAVAAEDLKNHFKIPVFEVVRPAIEKAISLTRNKRIGVIGTRATINSGIYEKMIKEVGLKIFAKGRLSSAWKVFSQAAPLLVSLIEEGWLKKMETKKIIKSYLHPLRMAQVDTLIMACTHYPLLREQIQLKIGRQVKLVDPGQEVILELKEFLEKNPEIEKTLTKMGFGCQFFVSDLTPKCQEIVNRWLGRDIKLQIV